MRTIKKQRPVPCDKCGKPNDRAAESNYCSACAAAYQARIRRDPEQRPVGSR
jgi:ribosomal protein L37E